MTEYQTHAALVATLETEIVRLRAVNAELRKSIQAPVQPDTKLEQAARQALEALAGMLAIVDDSQAVAGYHLNGELEPWGGFPEVEAARAAITALREALEAAPQPAAVGQEPVAWMFQLEEAGLIMCVTVQQIESGFEKNNPRWQRVCPLYKAPQPARQPLTDAQIASACFSYRHDFGLLSKQEQESIIFQAREWERALGKEREIGGEA